MPFDKIRFKNQRLDLIGHDDRAHVEHALRHQLRSAHVRGAVLKIGAHPAAQRNRLADVQDAVIFPHHHIDARGIGDLGKRLRKVCRAGHSLQFNTAGSLPSFVCHFAQGGENEGPLRIRIIHRIADTGLDNFSLERDVSIPQCAIHT